MDRNVQSADGGFRAATTASKDRHPMCTSISRRAWNDFFHEKGASFLRKTGVTIALLGCGIAFNVSVIPERKAEGGIVTSASVDPQIRAFGAQYAVANGGHLGYLNTNAGPGSGVYLGNGWVVTAGHNVAAGGTMTFGTGPNYNADPGILYIPSQIILHPNYSYLGNHDIALIKYADLTLPSNLTILNARPEVVSTIWLAGYGTTGTEAGYTGQDGYIRAGTSGAAWNSSFVVNQGFSSQYYVGAFMRPTTRPFDIRFADGDSGGGAFISPNEIYALGIAASIDPAGRATYLLDITGGANRTFIDSVVGVPEPTSLLLVGGPLLFSATTFRRRRFDSN